MRIEIKIKEKSTGCIIDYKNNPGCPNMTLNGVLINRFGRNVSDKYEIIDYRIYKDE